MTEEEYRDKITTYDFPQLLDLWEDLKKDNYDKEFWNKGKLFEYLVLRAFELYGATVTYPFSVDTPSFDRDTSTILEQIDGAISLNGLYTLIECKDSLLSTKIR